jgi:hypothetical protein
MIMKDNARILPRGRISQWSKDRIDKLSTPELRALLVNAERLKETEVAALCTEILDARPRGHAPARRDQRGVPTRGLVTRAKAFEMHGVSPRNRKWSRGGVRTDGAVVLTLRAEEVQEAGARKACLLWGPGVGDPESPGAQERLEHCRIALERGAAEGLLVYGGAVAGTPTKRSGVRADRVDAQTVLKLDIEKRNDEYWATWVPHKHAIVKEFN